MVFPRRRLLEALIASPALPLLLPAPAGADHPGPLRDAPMGPVAVAVTAGLLALAVALLVLVIVMLLARKDSSPE
jgi:hypothetical protein